MIGIPIFSDQFNNVDSFVAKKMMIRIDLKDLSEETLDSSLSALLKNPAYKFVDYDNFKQFSKPQQ